MKIILFPLFMALVAMHASMATPNLRVSKAAEDLALDMSSSSWPDTSLDAEWSDVEWSTSSKFPAAASKLPWHHRAMTSVLSRLCFAGLPAGCLCTEDAVRSAIADASSGKLLRPRIRICSGVCKHISLCLLACASQLYSSHFARFVIALQTLTSRRRLTLRERTFVSGASRCLCLVSVVWMVETRTSYWSARRMTSSYSVYRLIVVARTIPRMETVEPSS
jgi:hypothetical protein